MTTPNDPNQQGPYQPGQPPPQPQYGQPYQQPEYGQPQYQQPQPQYGQPYQQPEYGQPQYQQPQYGQPGEPQFTPSYGEPLPEPGGSHRGGRGKLVAGAAAAVVVLGGAVATYAAVTSSTSAGGSASPREAVQSAVDDLNNSDLLGLLNDLAPGERDAVAKPFQDSFDQLKRVGIVKPDASLNKVDAIAVHTGNLTFAPRTITVNDHVQIVQLTGGTLSLTADATKLPLTSDFLNAITRNSAGPTTQHKTVDIGQIVSRTGEPVQIATEQVGGRWYPSVLYTIADYATQSAHLHAPSAADAIPAHGASSPDAAVQALVTSLSAGNFEQAIEVLSPDEMAVLHDYGKLIVDRAPTTRTPVRLSNLHFTDTTIDGGVRVSLASVDVTTADGQTASVRVEPQCVDVTANGQHHKLCAGQILSGLMPFTNFSPAQEKALSDVLSGLTKIGVDTSQSGGQWYVNPLRTMFDLGPTLLSGLQPDDAQALLHAH